MIREEVQRNKLIVRNGEQKNGLGEEEKLERKG